MITIEQELSNLTNNFKDDDVAIRCKTKEEKLEALKIFREHYDVVEVSDGRRSDNEPMSWVIACSNPKQIQESLLTEAEDEEEVDVKDDEDIEEVDDVEVEDDTDAFEEPQEDFGEFDDDLELDDLAAFDDTEDTMDLDDENYDTIDDVSEVGKADKITVLKKRASDLSKKWLDVYNQIVDLAKDLDLTVTHNDDFVIELTKADGTDSKYEKDLDDIEAELKGNDDIDDSFGPSEFDGRATQLGDDVEINQNESLESSSNVIK